MVAIGALNRSLGEANSSGEKYVFAMVRQEWQKCTGNLHY
jgi:hypothetical protein